MRIWILVALLGSLSLYGQEFAPSPSLAMGKTAAAPSGLLAITTNSAGLYSLTAIELAAAYQQHFLSADIASQALLLGLPISPSSRIGLGFVKYGLKDVSSLLRVGASWCRLFGENFSSSLTINYHQYYVRSYSSATAFSADLGLLYRFSDALQTGLYFKNIGNQSFASPIDETIDRELGLGFSYAFSDEFTLATDLVRRFPKELSYRAGFSYRAHPQLVLRAGALSNPIQYTAGVGFKHKHWRFEWAQLFHVQLGISPQLLMAYAF